MLRTRGWIEAWLLLVPGFVFLIAFTHVPALVTIWNSFLTTPRGRRPARWAGLENYETLLSDPTFWKVLKNNAIYAAGTIPLSIGIALVMALWVNRQLAGRGFVRMAYFTPTVLPMIAVANIWMFFYTPGFGLVDQIGAALGLGQTNILGSADTALWGVMVVNSFRMVDHIFILTGGGPDNASSLLLFYIYEVAFRFWDTAYGATLTVVLLAFLMILAIGQFVLFDRRVHYR